MSEASVSTIIKAFDLVTDTRTWLFLDFFVCLGMIITPWWRIFLESMRQWLENLSKIWIKIRINNRCNLKIFIVWFYFYFTWKFPTNSLLLWIGLIVSWYLWWANKLIFVWDNFLFDANKTKPFFWILLKAYLNV